MSERDRSRIDVDSPDYSCRQTRDIHAAKMCCNGCEAPVCPPSKVLCRSCMGGISTKMEAILRGLEARARKP